MSAKAWRNRRRRARRLAKMRPSYAGLASACEDRGWMAMARAFRGTWLRIAGEKLPVAKSKGTDR